MSADSSTPSSTKQSSTVYDWLKLMRLPTVFTALSNVLCGFFISTTDRDLPALAARPEFWLLLLSSAGLYLGGMVLNDVFDAELDSRERPERPIPSGRISHKHATVFGVMLVATGLIAAFAADVVSKTQNTSFQIASVLAAAVVLYDSVLKSTIAGPLGMGACRFLNIMLGASCCGSWDDVWSTPQLAVATALAVYVIGVTWFARNEAGNSSRSGLMAGLSVVIVGLCIDGWVALQDLQPQSPATGALIALGLIGANVIFRAAKAISANQPVLLQKTVGFMLLHIIFLDATMTFCMTGSGRMAAAVVVLVIPATLMKRVIPMS